MILKGEITYNVNEMTINLPSYLKIRDNTLLEILSVLLDAGSIALKYHGSDQLNINIKQDGSPVTNADLEVNDFIVKKLRDITPHIEIISEESENNICSGHTFWLIDPIDGTKNYINGSSGYTINIALIYEYLPVVGFIYHPSLGEIYYNDLSGKVIFYEVSNESKTVFSPQKICHEIRVLMDKDQLNLDKIEQKSLFSKVYPSCARSKISMILHNQADVYYLYRCLMEWDTAPVHAILRVLGGDIVDFRGNSLLYGKPLFCNSSVIVYNQNALHNRQIILDSY
jgi:3'(2'), 5'-bisphosphate nucleotidase